MGDHATAREQKGRRPRSRTGREIEAAALELFAAHGYRATSLRDIASAVGIQVGSLYNHIASKDALLSQIVVGAVQGLLESVEEAARRPAAPARRLELVVASYLRHHVEHRAAMSVARAELRELAPEDRVAVLALQEACDGVLADAVTAASRGAAARADVDLHVGRIGTFALRVAESDGWSADDLVDTCSALILRSVGVAPSRGGAVAQLPVRASRDSWQEGRLGAATPAAS